ncbi:hypothetical protein BN59_02771 [Legionella massiliensis]|uniref:Uncharacterized protein n=1 Tax=Legionella massiliensis TaxID=1034943 RepID=A0A078L019_9GAMM|nr:hypothetical protein [Legionella massiliensis]CDZ78461.1 hypothetical protein BN59_02771 [Legionella massiliensis]CEE14199.1 hypothetical protein BN1094_02771 [Legionella massiliensis]
MQDKTFVFFSRTSAIKDNQQEAPVERVKKYIDAEIAYKKVIAERLLKGKQDEIWEIILSNTVHLYDRPLQIQSRLQNGELIQSAKKEFTTKTIDDIKDCTRLKNSAEKDSTDYLYLNIYFQYSIGLIDIETTATKKNIQRLLNNLYKKTDAKRLLRDITKDINTKNIKSPIMASTHLKKEMLAILKTEISPSCLRFLEDVEINCVSDKYACCLSAEADARLRKNKLVNQLTKTLPNSESQKLIDEYFAAQDALSQDSLVFGHMILNDSYLKIFERMKVLYQLEDKMTDFLHNLEKSKHEAKAQLVTQSLELVTPVEITELPTVDLDDSQHTQTLATVLNTANDVLDSNTTTQEAEIPQLTPRLPDDSSSIPTAGIQQSIADSIVFTETLELQTASAPLETNNCANAEEDEAETTSVYTTIYAPSKHKKSKKEEDGRPKAVLSKAEYGMEEKEEGEEDEAETASIYTTIYAPLKHKKSKRQEAAQPEKPQENTLNLNKDHLDTFMKVFGLIPYDSINLRALVNLTLEFGGVIKKTGANRCRIEMKNIYAFILAPIEEVAPSTTATVTMHGGGHRSTRSQNHDRNKAPDYLIEQFREAFTRAGFTPANLGLENSANYVSSL